jgi:biopolymer transport protein ExbD
MKFKSAHGSDSDESLAEINIVPLVDIMLVLLIIFMVAAPMMDQKDAIKVDIPEASVGPAETQTDDVVIQVLENGAIYVNGDAQDKHALANIEDRLQQIFDEREKKLLYIEADQSVKYNYVVEVMAIAKRVGVEQIGLKTRPETATP